MNKIQLKNDDFTEIIFNDITELWSLWLNGKIVKIAKNKKTLTKILEG